MISLLIIIEEIIFILATIGKISNLFFVLLFSILIGVILETLFKKKIYKIILAILIGILFITHFIYYSIFESFLLVDTMFTAGMALPFASILFDKILSNWYIILFMIIPIVAYIFLISKIKFDFNRKIGGIIAVILYLFIIILINFNTSLKNIYYKINLPLENISNFGLLTTIRLDIQRTIFNFEDDVSLNVDNDFDYSDNNYNILDINFDIDTDNEEILEISEYFKNQQATLQNEYTGLFKDKNLIIILAESFSELGIDENITPTLYHLYNTGFKFNNYYSPLYLRATADSEYILDNSLLPVDGKITLEEDVNNYMPYNYATVFKKEGYNIRAYHNYDYTYYKRDEYFGNLGYDYLGCGNGLENKMNCNQTIPSDLEMIEATVDDYINDEKFMTYYVTMSGHANYEWSHSIVQKNYHYVENLPYSEKAKYYLATQIELDKALELLLDKLEKNNRLDDTVILLIGDHYPFGLTLDEMNELSTYERDNTFEKTKMPLIIYNSEVSNQTIDKYCSNLDLLPTILNLYGIEYDSRLLLGKDIFSSSESTIIFHNRSFITNRGKYNSLMPIFGESLTEEYANQIKDEIYYKFKISRLILENDYYKYLKDQLE